MQTPETVEVTTGDNPIGSVIWLHGLGADGHDFEPIVPEFCLPANIPLRFVFPHAPLQPVTINDGMVMRSWYDILSFDEEGRTDRAGVLKSSDVLHDLIGREVERGIKEEKIVIAGFSQGGAVAIHTALRTSYNIAGLMALSTYMALRDDADTAVSRRDLPIFMAHGSFDPVLKIDWGRASADKMIEIGYSVDWHEYPMAHAICPQEVADISSWLLGIYS
ncbi:MAG: carboxylesterase [Woeseiaceae bacterium]|nr:carboxylesterase [Gammaproteobacteria bacterium]MDG2288329.1 carboxylesterase [Woeseiaceae bacterium]